MSEKENLKYLKKRLKQISLSDNRSAYLSGWSKAQSQIITWANAYDSKDTHKFCNDLVLFIASCEPTYPKKLKR